VCGGVVAFISEAGGIVATRIGVVSCEGAGEDPLGDGVRDGGGSDGIVSKSLGPYMSSSLPCSSLSSSSFWTSESLPLPESDDIDH
jgi:hypothetical protein